VLKKAIKRYNTAILENFFGKDWVSLLNLIKLLSLFEEATILLPCVVTQEIPILRSLLKELEEVELNEQPTLFRL